MMPQYTIERHIYLKFTCIYNFSNSGQTSVKNLPKKISQSLGLSLLGDLKIVLGTAEKLRPGFYYAVLGNPKIDSSLTAI